MARVGRGKNTFSEDYTTHHLLIRASLSHPPPSLQDGSYFHHPHTNISNKREGFDADVPQNKGRRRPRHHTTLPTTSSAAIRHNHILTSLTLSTRPAGEHQRSAGEHQRSTGEHQRSTITLHLECLYYLKYPILSILLYALAQSHPERL